MALTKSDSCSSLHIAFLARKEDIVPRKKKQKEYVPESLDIIWTETEWEDVEERIMSSEAEQPLNILLEKERRELVRGLLSELNPKERVVIRMHYGILFSRAWTFEEIAEFTRITRQALWNVEQIALRKLREAITPRMYRYFVLGMK